jgi:hypothetical protein
MQRHAVNNLDPKTEELHMEKRAVQRMNIPGQPMCHQRQDDL